MSVVCVICEYVRVCMSVSVMFEGGGCCKNWGVELKSKK